MPSLKVRESAASRATPAVPESGTAETTRGGTMSGGPPDGAPLRAQPPAAAARASSTIAATVLIEPPQRARGCACS